MERNGHFQPDDNAVSFRTHHFQTPGTAKDQHHQQPAVSYRQSPCKSPPPHHQQQASPAMLQALATAYKLMQIQQEHFRIMASISGTTAAWDAIYNDRFAEEDARLKAECERLLGHQHDTTGLFTSPEAANHLNEQSSNDLLQAERGRRPYPVDQEPTAAQDRRESVEGGIKPPQLNIQADAAVETEIPDQPVSKQTPVYPTSNALNRSDDVITGGGSQLESSKKVAQSISLYPGMTVARSNNHVTGGHQFATTATKRGCLSCFINTQPRQAKTTRSHRLRLRQKHDGNQHHQQHRVHRCTSVLLLSCPRHLYCSSAYDQQGQRRNAAISTLFGEHPSCPMVQQQLGSVKFLSISNIFKFRIT